jgi:hypothetical protein
MWRIDNVLRLVAGERRDPVLEQGQLGGDIRRQQVAPRGQNLSKLHVNRPEILQRETQTGAARQFCNLAAHG